MRPSRYLPERNWRAAEGVVKSQPDCIAWCGHAGDKAQRCIAHLGLAERLLGCCPCCDPARTRLCKRRTGCKSHSNCSPKPRQTTPHLPPPNMLSLLINVSHLGWNGRFGLPAYYCNGIRFSVLAAMVARDPQASAPKHAAPEPSDAPLRCTANPLRVQGAVTKTRLGPRRCAPVI